MSGRWRLAVVLLCMATVLSGCGFVVPDVKGKTLAEAEKSLAEAGFKLGHMTYDESAQAKAGIVVAQEPASGRRADEGAAIKLTLAGPAPVPVPGVLGLGKKEAEAAIVAGGLVVGDVRESFHPQAAVGTVATQDPEEDTQVPPGTEVDILISTGPEPQPVPNVVGGPIDDAERVLSEAGFKSSKTEVADPATKGTVLTQKPSGTESALRGTTVALTYSSGVEMVRVPGIEGLLPSDADAKLRSAGLSPFGVSVHGPTESDHGDIGRAYRQRPGAGRLVPKGTTVSYHYWWESQ